MHCPFCHAEETKVVDSRLVSSGKQVKRRRECCQCTQRFSTFETAELVMPAVIKQDGERQAFNERNLRQGMLRSLEKRPVSLDSLEEAIVEIKQSLRSMGEREIDSRIIGELVMKQLHRLDEVAYVRFASVYKRFKDVSEFSQAVDELKSSRGESGKI